MLFEINEIYIDLILPLMCNHIIKWSPLLGKQNFGKNSVVLYETTHLQLLLFNELNYSIVKSIINALWKAISYYYLLHV